MVERGMHPEWLLELKVLREGSMVSARGLSNPAARLSCPVNIIEWAVPNSLSGTNDGKVPLTQKLISTCLSSRATTKS
jgi:hypothetical protein